MPHGDATNWNRLARAALATGLACLAFCGQGMIFRPGSFLRSYLVGYSYWLGIALGSLAIVMVHRLTGGRWGLAIGRLAEAASRTLPLLLVLFTPLVLGAGSLYPWASADAVANDPVLQHKSLYLNLPAFTVRAAVYFAIWITLAFLLSRWSRRGDESDDPRWASRAGQLSGPGLVLWGLTITFAAIDWVMSLEARWFSTIFAVVLGINQVLSALALAIVVLAVLASRLPREEETCGFVSKQVCRDLGNLLLTVVMFWAYTAFAQFLLIWAGNVPEEIAWYLPRFAGGWLGIAVFLILCQFAMPFVFLLFRRTKDDLRNLARIAAFLLATCFVNLVWQILPAGPPEGSLAGGLDLGYGLEVLGAVVALFGVGGVWMAMFLWQLKKMPLVPLHAAAIEEVPNHE
jgi:hypothetical protein